MASTGDKPISGLDLLSDPDLDLDYLPIVDYSESDTSKRTKRINPRAILVKAGLDVKVNDIGEAGLQSYGVGIMPFSSMPLYIEMLPGTLDKNSPQYGNYKCKIDGSIMVYVPAFWYKTSYDAAAPVYKDKVETRPYATYPDEVRASLDGFVLPRVFRDGDGSGGTVIRQGILVDKYKWSLTNAVEGVSGIASSIKNSSPISSSPSTKRWRTANISGAVAGSGIVTITSTSHGFKTNNTVTISGVVGMTDINGTFVITAIDANSYTIPVSTAQTYTSGGVAKVANYPGSFSNCISNGQTPADIYGGAYSVAKSRGNDFFVTPIYVWQAIQILQQAHAQASTSSTYCAWYDGTGVKNYPKGNNNYGADTDDGTITFSNCTDDYWKALPGNEAKQNGGASNLAKTTHNGQECGISGVNGNQFDVVSGLTCKTTTYTIDSLTGDGSKVTIHTTASHNRSVNDWIMLTNLGAEITDKLFKVTDIVNSQTLKVASTVTSFTDTSGTMTAGTFYLLKDTFQVKNLTGGNSLTTTDMFNSTFLSTYCDIVTPDFVNEGAFAQRHGNGANQVLEFSTNKTSNAYKKASALLPKSNGVSTSGTNQFGTDYFYQYLRDELVPVVAGYWGSGSNAGVFSLRLNNYRANSRISVSGRSCLYV